MLFKLNKSIFFKDNSSNYFCEFPLIQSVLEQKQDGEFYGDLKNNINELFVLHEAGFGYYFNAVKESSHFLEFITKSEDLPLFFHLYSPPEFLLNSDLSNAKYDVRIRKRFVLQIDNIKPFNQEVNHKELYMIHEISASNYDQINKHGLIDNKFWRSKSDFLENGFGVCIFDNTNNPLSICYSASVANGIAEIDIITRPEYRNNGLAKIVTSEFIKLCFAKMIAPNWDCFEENKGSLKTALSVGFSLKKEYIFLSFYRKK